MKKIFLVVLFSLIPLIISSSYFVFNENFYQKEFSKFDVYSKFNIDLNEYNSEVLDYLKGKKKSLPDTLYLNGREVKHMEDVRKISVKTIAFFRLIIILSILFLIINKQNLNRTFFYSGLVSITFSIILLLFFFFSFNSSFDFFHSLFFEEGTWLFDPSDTIVNVYPIGLFFDIFVRIFILSFAISLLFLFIGIISKRFINYSNLTNKK